MNATHDVAGFAKTFRHWRNGKVYRAADYGHKAWPIRTRNGKRK